MYCIITDNEKVLRFARRNGVRTIEVEKAVIIKNKQEQKFVNITPKMVDSFLSEFPKIEMNCLGAKYLKYILDNRLGCSYDIEQAVYPTLSRKFNNEIWRIKSALLNVYALCISNMPNNYANFFDKYECSVHWGSAHLGEFIKVCQEYLYEYGDELTNENRVLMDRKINYNSVQEFLNDCCISKKSLGYKCLKHILENKIELTFDTKEEVYGKLAEKFDTRPSAIASAITNTYTNIIIRSNYPKDFQEYYSDNKPHSLLSIGDASIVMVDLMLKYLS